MKRQMVSRILLTVPLLLAPLAHTESAAAVTGADFVTGRIIDDVLFADKNSMSVDQIQVFLNAKVGTGANGKTAGQCDTNGTRTSELGGGTRADYGAAHGNPAPFTCLKDYYEVPKTSPGPGVPASNYGNKPIPAGAKSAANIIWDAAQQYSISPKVLLTTIQKESIGPLVTDDWPLASQYTYALGAHCPDSNPDDSKCDTNYSGFSLQVYESARLFRYYLDNMSQAWWPYKKPGNNMILYNPETSCGSSTVNIQSMATAALYTYTPYQPNQAALSNLYGTGDSCSSYGNRNFWVIYNAFFGSSIGCPSIDTAYIYRLYRKTDGDYLYTQNPTEICQAIKFYGYTLETSVMPNDVLPTDDGARSVYRLSRGSSHLFTTDPVERDVAMQTYGYVYEGVAFYVSSLSDLRCPVYRLSRAGHYILTASSSEKNAYVQSGYTYEGVAFYAHTAGATISIYRLSKNGIHLYTSSQAERNAAISSYGYSDEGIAFYGISGPTGDNMPVYRLQRSGRYLNTVYPDEKVIALGAGYSQETSYYYEYPSGYSGTVPVYRLSKASNGDYLLTTNPAERDIAVQQYGYRLEGVGFGSAP